MMNQYTMYRRSRLVSVLAVLLLVCLLCGLTGCGKSAGYTSEDTKGQKALWISCDWAEGTEGRCVVRRIAYDEIMEAYVTEQEYTADAGGKGNTFGLVVSREGTYQIELSAEGYETQMRLMEVDGNSVYRLGVHMPPLEVQPDETLPEETSPPEETTLPPETTLAPETQTP